MRVLDIIYSPCASRVVPQQVSARQFCSATPQASIVSQEVIPEKKDPVGFVR